MNIAIFGAGSIGAYVGGALLASGADVVLIGRARMQASVARHGLTLTDLNGHRSQLAPDQVPYAHDPGALALRYGKAARAPLTTPRKLIAISRSISSSLSSVSGPP